MGKWNMDNGNLKWEMGNGKLEYGIWIMGN